MIKKIKFLFFLVIVLISVSAFSIDKKLVERFKNSSAIALYPDSPIYELCKKIELSFDGKNVKKRVIHFYQVLNNTGRDKYGDYKILYNRDKELLKVNEAFTLNSDLTKTPVKKDSINDVNPVFLSGSTLYSNILEKVYSFPTIDPEDGIYIDYEKVKKGDSISGIYYFYSFYPKQEEIFEVKIPKDRELYYKVFGNVKVSQKLLNGKKLYRFSMKEMPELKEEEYLPPMNVLSPHVVFSTKKSWRELRAKDKIKKLTSKVPVSILKKFKGIKGEKLFIKVFRFVKERIKLVNLPFSIQGIYPSSLDKVFETLEGSLVDKAYAFSAILNSLGYKSGVCFSFEDFFKETDIPSEEALSAGYSYIKYGGRTYFFDFSEVGTPIYWISEAYGKKLIVPETGKFINYTPLKKNFAYSKIKIDLRKENRFLYNFSAELSGGFEEDFRSYYYYKDKKEVEKDFEYFSQVISDGSTVKEYKIENLKDFSKSIKVYQKIEGKELFVVQKGAYIVELPNFPYRFSNEPLTLTLNSRNYPLYFKLPHTVLKTYEINFKKEISPLYIPEKIEFKGDGFLFLREFRHEGKKIKVKERVELKKALFNKKEYKTLKEAYEKFNERKSKIVILSFKKEER